MKRSLPTSQRFTQPEKHVMYNALNGVICTPDTFVDNVLASDEYQGACSLNLITNAFNLKLYQLTLPECEQFVFSIRDFWQQKALDETTEVSPFSTEYGQWVKLSVLFAKRKCFDIIRVSKQKMRSYNGEVYDGYIVCIETTDDKSRYKFDVRGSNEYWFKLCEEMIPILKLQDRLCGFYVQVHSFEKSQGRWVQYYTLTPDAPSLPPMP